MHFKVVSPRKTKLGDCRYPIRKNTQTVVTVNQDLAPFQFLVTSLHELAHAKTFQEYGLRVPAHGKEWKHHFSEILNGLCALPDVPEDEVTVLQSIAQKPKATSYGSAQLQDYLKDENTVFLKDIANDSIFNFNNRDFRKIKLLRTYVLCSCLESGRKYKIHGSAQINALRTEE